MRLRSVDVLQTSRLDHIIWSPTGAILWWSTGDSLHPRSRRPVREVVFLDFLAEQMLVSLLLL